MIRRSALSLLLLLLPGTAAPAAAQTITDGRAWLTVTVQGRPGPESPWRWSLDAIARSREGVGELDVTTVRPMLIYAASTRTSVGGGYALVSSYRTSGGVATEHRVFGLIGWTAPAAGGTLSMRVRFEDRMIESNSGMVWRLRPQARFSHPIRPGSRVALVGSDELSVHLNTTTRYPRGIDQNRGFAGLSTAWSPHLRTEIGYLNQFLPGHGAASRMNHIVSTTITAAF
jgi:hypothetical protein